MRNYTPSSDLLQNRVVLITGAGQGIGRIAALTFAAHGATVVLHGRDIKKLESVYDEIESSGAPQPAIITLDFANATDGDYETLAHQLRSELGKLDGILHNAAYLTDLSPLEIQTIEQWLLLLRVNLIAPFALTRACASLLRESNDASVIMTLETHGHEPAAYWGAFAIAKSGLATFTKILSQEWEMYPNLRINALVPGPVQSPLRLKTHPAENLANLPTPHALMPDYLYLIGPDSKGTTGQVISCQ